MKMRLSGAVLAAAASFMLCAAPAHADNYPVKDGSGALQTFASKVAGFIHHPLHVMEGLFGGAPTPVNMTNAGALDVTVVGGATGTTTKANAADPTLIEGSGTNQLSTDLAGYLRVLTKQSGVWTVNLGSLNGAATAAKQPSLGTAGAASTDVLTVQGISSMTPLKVDGSAVTQPISGSLTNISGTISLPTGASTSANQATANTSLGTIATNSATQATAANQASVIGTKAAGTAAASSLLTGGVFNTALPTLTTGQQAAIQLDSSGRQIVVCGSGCSGGAQFAEDSAHVTGDLGTLSLAVRADTAANTAGTTGDYSALINDSVGRLWSHPQAAASDFADGWDATQGTKADAAWTTGSGSSISLLKAIAGSAIDNTTPSPVKIDQTTPGTTNGVRADHSGATGSAVPSRAGFVGVNSGGNLTGLIQADSSAPINVSTATTTQLVALSSGKKIYVTSLDVIAAGTGNITFEYGTGTNCGTGTNLLTGAYNLTAQAGLAKGNGLGPVLVVPASNALCVLTSAAVQMSGSIAYTQF
jgi:hypothetical protein